MSLLFPICLLEILSLEKLWNMLDAPCDLCNGIHGQHHLISKNLGHNLSILELSVPPEHSNEFWVYQLWIVEVTTDATEL